MGKYTKADGTNTTNGEIPVVTPSNMGKGLKFNVGTKQYDIAVGDGLTIDAMGNIILADNAPQEVNSFLTHNYKLGFHVFTGSVDNATRMGTLGLPTDFNAEDGSSPMAVNWGDYTGSQQYDFNGYYIASGNELDVYIINDTTAWMISNDHGVNPDGTLKLPSGWGMWKRVGNVSAVSSVLVNSLQQQVNSLAKQVQANTSKNGEQDTAIAEIQLSNTVLGQVTYQKIGDFEIRKFPDGTMIQTFRFTPPNGYFRAHETDKTVTWANAFIDKPKVFWTLINTEPLDSYTDNSMDSMITVSEHKSTNTVLNFSFYELTYHGTPLSVDFMAIGRWK